MDNLSAFEKTFVDGLARGLSKSAAYRAAGDDGPYHRNKASLLAKEPRIKAAVALARGDRQALEREAVRRQLAQIADTANSLVRQLEGAA